MSATHIAGNLTADPELRFTQSGNAVVNFTIASTPRRFDKAAGEWKDGETLYLRATAWGKQAESVAESLKKGDRVVATGTLAQSSYTDKDGIARTSIELDVDEVGPSLRWSARPEQVPAAGQAAATAGIDA